MKQFQSLLTVALVLLLAANAQSRASYKGKVAMIETAQIIAVVEITAIEEVSVKGKHYTYRQKASAKVGKILKGKLPKNVFLFGDENFRCASCRFKTGRYLVFLDSDGDLLTGNNWGFSTLKITGDSAEKVEWFADDRMHEKKEAPLPDVLREVAAVLAKPE